MKKAVSGAVIIKTDGSFTPFTPKNGSTLELDEMQSIVGGYIEIVGQGRFRIVVDEEGKIKRKEPNLHATSIARTLGAIYPTDIIAGDAILCPKHMLR